MGTSIAMQTVKVATTTAASQKATKVSLLPGAIEGVETTYYLQSPGGSYSPSFLSSLGQIFFFVQGEGEILAGDNSRRVSGMAVFVARGNHSICIRATSAALEYLEILVTLHDEKAQQFRRGNAVFASYSECESYTEAIKSAGTTSRTIVPPETAPRFCMGSVEAWGPDEVAPHAHAMLEQLFFGLPGNTCLVTANSSEAMLGERTLLHIPLGSTHGVRVHAGCRMHYLWMDFFRRQEDVAWVRDQHRPLQRSGVSRP